MFKTLQVMALHATNEVGATPERRYKAASKMLSLARSSDDANWRHKTLHKALDVVVCEGCIEELVVNTPLHRNLWSVGHEIATEIMKHQDMLNISGYWFCESYEEAVEKMANV